jgi:hypothetical protein
MAPGNTITTGCDAEYVVRAYVAVSEPGDEREAMQKDGVLKPGAVAVVPGIEERGKQNPRIQPEYTLK